MNEFTLIVPYYRNPSMLRAQAAIWRAYPPQVRVIVVDDGSPEPAAPILAELLGDAPQERLQCYRIEEDIPWNRGGARNLGAEMSQTEWIVHEDIDHVLPVSAAMALLELKPDPASWYRFPRFRVGAADETRKKDTIDPGVQFGEIHPHIDSYLCTRDLYWKAGGYNESFSGCLGGGSPFLKELTRIAGHPRLLLAPICLHVYTRHAIPDASDTTLSRETGEFTRRRRRLEAAGQLRGKNPLRFQWSRAL